MSLIFENRSEGNLPNYFRIIIFTATTHYPLGLDGGDQDRGILVEARAGIGLQNVRVKRILKTLFFNYFYIERKLLKHIIMYTSNLDKI